MAKIAQDIELYNKAIYFTIDQFVQILNCQWTLKACRTPLHEKCPKHHGHKGVPGVTPKTCGVMGERAQVMLVWMRALDVGNVSYPRRLGVTRVRP